MSQKAPAHTAVMAIDIASAVAMRLTHSRIDILQFQSASFPYFALLENRGRAARG
jgi:hypothetical protein